MEKNDRQKTEVKAKTSQIFWIRAVPDRNSYSYFGSEQLPDRNSYSYFGFEI